MYLETEKFQKDIEEKGDKERERSFIHCFALQMVAMTREMAGQSQESRTPSGVLAGVVTIKDLRFNI